MFFNEAFLKDGEVKKDTTLKKAAEFYMTPLLTLFIYHAETKSIE